MQCPTKKIEDGNGSYIVINKEDFDSKNHKEYSEKAKPKSKAKKAVK